MMPPCPYGMMSVYDGKRKRRMKKKPIIVLLLVVLVIVAGFGIFLLARNSRGPAASGEDVRLFYYRNIPGLKRAEEDNRVLSVHKSFALDEKGLTIEIDRLWIGADTAWALYHIDDGTSLNLSGALVLTGTEGGTLLYAAGQAETGQIRADNGLYGYFIMDRLDEGQEIGAIEQASLYPVVTHKKWLSTKITELNAVPIAVSQNPADESEQDIALNQEANELGNLGALTPTAVTLAESRTYLSLDWESSGYALYGLQGTLSSRKGENQPLDGRVDDVRIPLPAFNYPDTLYTLRIDRAYFIYPGALTLTIDPKDYRKRNTRQGIDQPAFQPGGPQCILDRVRVERDRVYLDMTPVDGGEGILGADPWETQTNAVYCVNGRSGRMEGALLSDGEKLTIAVPREMWDQDLAIWVQVGDPLIELKPGIDIDLRGE